MCTIIMKDHLVGKNYDSVVKTGMIYTNQRGLIKQAAAAPPNPALDWVSSYGSITFSQAGREYPVSGMNEMGLVAEQATFPGTIYRSHGGKPAASSLEMTQYLLDTCADTEEALHALERNNIVRTSWPVHYALADSGGTMAVVEYREGTMHVYRGRTCEPQLLTNTEYRVNELQQECRDADDLAGILTYRERPDTVWTNLYDLQALEIFVKNAASREQFTIKLQEIDFSFGAQNQMLDLAAGETSFQPYTEERNRELISAFFFHPSILEIMALPDPNAMIDFMAEQSKKYDRNHEIMLRFLSGEQISQLPMKCSHKKLVLQYLSSKFEAGKEYSEGQVNAMIDAWHTFGDYFILRRELIDSGLLKRLPNGSKYWRETT